MMRAAPVFSAGYYPKNLNPRPLTLRRRHHAGNRGIENLDSSGCRFHCETFPDDPKCTPDAQDDGARRSAQGKP